MVALAGGIIALVSDLEPENQARKRPYHGR